MKAKTKNKSKVMLCIEGFDISNFEASLEQFPGKKAFINDTVESARMKFKKVLSELNVLIQASKEGDLKSRANAKAFDGDQEKIMLGVNDMLNKILIPIQYANKILKQICTGNIMERVELELKGGTER